MVHDTHHLVGVRLVKANVSQTETVNVFVVVVDLVVIGWCFAQDENTMCNLIAFEAVKLFVRFAHLCAVVS